MQVFIIILGYVWIKTIVGTQNYFQETHIQDLAIITLEDPLEDVKDACVD